MKGLQDKATSCAPVPLTDPFDLVVQSSTQDDRRGFTGLSLQPTNQRFGESCRHNGVVALSIGVRGNSFRGHQIGLEVNHCRQLYDGSVKSARRKQHIMPSAFHKRLSQALAADSREQREIAAAIGTSQQQVSRWKRKVNPSPEMISKFIEVLGIDGHWLLTGQGSMKSGDRSDLAQRLDVVVDVASGHVSPDQLTALQVGVSLDKGQSDQLALQETLATAKQANASLSDIERRLAAIERFELTPMSELTDEETMAAKKLAEKAKTATFGEEAQALGEGTKGG